MDDDELQDDQLDGDDAQDGTDSGSDDSAPPTGDQGGGKDQKRVDDLMSKWQTEQARANRFEAELKQLRGQSTQDGDSQADAGDTELNEFKEFARESARNTLFASEPRLAEYGLKPEDLRGGTLAEMRASLKAHLGLIDGIESRARNKILAEHGLSPEVNTGASTEKEPKFSEMSDEEFAKFLEKRTGSPSF